ncbi:single-pass membrane and coiled-coil domain-containing protein 3 [Pseudophryne corroboree]|uniref:single-pass membrane and coiled-coil domain-containing protein 3 n=1 Tax=Pseudophryne corroboree TaxID=495146 RepID=UPI00308121C3
MYTRYIDDVFMLWTGSREAFIDMMHQVNLMNDSIKFTFDIQAETINFLDVKIVRKDGTFITSIYQKPTDVNILLLASSHHPKPLKNGLPYSQYLRILSLKMTLKDLIYPNNPKKREEIARLHCELLHCMRRNFQLTKKLILILNKHFGCQLRIPEIKDNASIKENCHNFIKNMTDIQDEVQKIDNQLKILLEPTLYEKLHDIKESESSKIEIAQKVVSIILSKATASTTAFIVKLISSNITTVLANKLITLLAEIGASVLGAVGIAVLGLGIDVIIGAILGAVERDQLERSVKEYEMYLAEFKPASESYQDAILCVTSKLENMFQPE